MTGLSEVGKSTLMQKITQGEIKNQMATPSIERYRHNNIDLFVCGAQDKADGKYVWKHYCDKSVHALVYVIDASNK